MPIPQDTVLTVNASGHTINSWGAGLFFLPHMITVDKQNNVWVTDVALHQVFKFAPYGGGDQKPLIALGTRFQPGADDQHYCKPTSVAVSSDGNTFFVSDGYCNSRVIKYQVGAAAGPPDPPQVTLAAGGRHQVEKVTEWGKGAGPFTLKPAKFNFNIPHGLALAEDKNQVCVADRENGRVQCFDLDGKFVSSIQPAEFGSRIFSAAYTKAKGEGARSSLTIPLQAASSTLFRGQSSPSTPGQGSPLATSSPSTPASSSGRGTSLADSRTPTTWPSRRTGTPSTSVN